MGFGVGFGVASAVGSAITNTASSPLASSPTTTACPLTGDFEMDLGRIEMSTWRESSSETVGQSGRPSTGQTSSTLATL